MGHKSFELIACIDYTELRKQKELLIKMIANDLDSELNGLVHLIDNIQDHAVDDLGMTEKKVFNLKDSE